MILAETLKTLTTQTPAGLAQILHHSGYRGSEFKTAEFQGMTNGGEFCYCVTFMNEESGEVDQGKVFVRYDTATGYITADF